MTHPSSNPYLEAQVLTASPQKLQLILIEAALRFAKKGRLFREQGNESAACEAIGRAHRIAIEIVSALDPEIDPVLVGQVAAIYDFVSHALLEANLPENKRQLDDAIDVLEEERLTWQLLCEKIASESSGQNEAAVLERRGVGDESQTLKTELDPIAVHATAGDAAVPQGTPLSPSTYGPTPFFHGGPGLSHAGISGPSGLSGPTKKMASEGVSEPATGGFSLDA